MKIAMETRSSIRVKPEERRAERVIGGDYRARGRLATADGNSKFQLQRQIPGRTRFARLLQTSPRIVELGVGVGIWSCRGPFPASLFLMPMRHIRLFVLHLHPLHQGRILPLSSL